MQPRGQGATEYLLLIGGAVLIATIVLLFILSFAPSGREILDNSLGGYGDIDLDDGGNGPPTVPPPEDMTGPVTLDNGDVQLAFEETPAQDVILDHVTKTGGSTFDLSGNKLWDVSMVKISDYTIAGVVSPETGSCDPVQMSTWKSGSTTFLDYFWNHCPVVPSVPAEYINFKLHIELDDGSLIARWSPSVENHSPYGVQLVNLYVNIHPQTPNDRYLMPGTDGMLITNPTAALPTSQQSLHIEFTQLNAWYTPSTSDGIYFATQDLRNSRSKYTRRENKGSSIQFTFGAYGEEPLTTKSFSVPYPLALGMFNGDWYDAAQIYRSWVVSQNGITSVGKLKDRTDVPLWYKELGMQLIENYNVDQLDPALNPGSVGFFDAIKDYYLPCTEYHSQYPANPSVCAGPTAHSDQILSLFQWTWYNQYYNGTSWQETSPSGTPDGYGEYSLIDRLKPLLTSLDAHGIYMEGYTQPGIFSTGGPEYSTMQSQSFKLINGTTLVVSPHPNDPAVGAVMDPASQTWHDFFANNIRDNLAAQDGHGIYMDNPYANYGVNFSNTITPPHTKGKGGAHFYEGYRDMMIDTRNAAKSVNPDFILFHEQGMEAYVGASDSFSNSGTDSPVPPGFAASNVQNVPLMEVLYHDYQLFNSSNSNPDFTLGHYNAYQGLGNEEAYMQAIRANVALGFSFGRMVNSAEPYLAINTPNHLLSSGGSNFLHYTDFLKLLIKTRKSAAKQYLIYGQLLRSLPAFGTNTTYTFNDVYGTGAPYTQSIPDVLSSVWKGTDGSVGIVLVNPTNVNQVVTIPFVPSAYGVIGNYSELNLDNPAAHVSLVTFSKPFSGFASPITIPARGIRVIRAT